MNNFENNCLYDIFSKGSRINHVRTFTYSLTHRLLSLGYCGPILRILQTACRETQRARETSQLAGDTITLQKPQRVD